MPRRPALFLPGLLLLALLLVACAATPPRLVPAGAGWTQLGERTASDRVRRDEIAVGARAGEFARIKLGVRDRSVTFQNVVVHYMNGTRQDIEVRRTIHVGTETRAIDLTGADRRIARVVFVYETARSRDTRDPQAVVTLYGWR